MNARIQYAIDTLQDLRNQLECIIEDGEGNKGELEAALGALETMEQHLEKAHE